MVPVRLPAVRPSASAPVILVAGLLIVITACNVAAVLLTR